MRYSLVLLIALVASGVAVWQAEARAALKQRLLLRSLTAQLEPFGALRYGETRAHFWGSGHVENLRFEPGPVLRERHALPEGLALHVPKLHYRDGQMGEAWPLTVRFRFEQATLPLPAPWPTTFDGSLDWRYERDSGALALGFTLDAPRQARAEARLDLRLASPERLRGATLVRGSLRYEDRGLAQGERAALAVAGGADPDSASKALADRLGQWLSAQGLPPDAALQQTLSAFAREPLYLTLRLNPPGALRPETLPLFAPADRLAALGLESSTASAP